MSEIVVTKQPGRYRATVYGAPAGELLFEASGTEVVFTHTHVDPAFEGRGVGSALVRYAAKDVRSAGQQVKATCQFAAGWLQRHPEA